ncbi:hypothetical protein CCC_04217 [Paramagnetospirillum magnetotacticum MS-1]|uniref:Uncharacterized protein n=1 Tax=Paramagnetospirillum magnetotacticum MS-1 TaxID=272627 RepID=A0A0C2V2Y4_PARME|nr:hypothetical protein CCC_04217 [Paramagnetospirillum magnetotacticum MS-1]
MVGHRIARIHIRATRMAGDGGVWSLAVVTLATLTVGPSLEPVMVTATVLGAEAAP